MDPVSPLAIEEQERVKETSLVVGHVTVRVAAVVGGVRVAGRVGPRGPANSGEWWHGWPEWDACQRGGPPCPG